MKYYLTIILTISLLIAKDSPQVPGWGVYFGGALNGASMNTTPLVAWGRLPFQFVFIALAYWHTK